MHPLQLLVILLYQAAAERRAYIRTQQRRPGRQLCILHALDRRQNVGNHGDRPQDEPLTKALWRSPVHFHCSVDWRPHEAVAVCEISVNEIDRRMANYEISRFCGRNVGSDGRDA